MKKKLLFICFLIVLLPYRMNAQATDSTSTTLDSTYGWYVGVQGGVPFGVSIFTSLAANKTHLGWTATVFGGYRLNSLLSLELSTKVGQTTLGIRKNDVDANYWLGNDMVRYYAPVIDMISWDYKNLTSKVSFQQYALQFNLIISELFNSDSSCPWILEVSPSISAVRTKADFVTIDDKIVVAKGEGQWHLGVGGNMQVGYRVANHLSVGVYGGLTHLLGDHYDKLPKDFHKNNYLFESGLKFTWSLGKDVQQKMKPTQIISFTSIEKEEISVDGKEDQVIETEPMKINEEKIVEMVEILPTKVEEEISFSFPVIYFEFDRTTFKENEIPKLQDILNLLEKNPDVKITITGWCDTRGSRAVNNRYSTRRAETVKNWLVKNSIKASRIITIGKGSDLKEQIPAKARRSETTQFKEDKL